MRAMDLVHCPAVRRHSTGFFAQARRFVAGFRQREGFQNARSCRCAAVFVDESAESVAALDLSVTGWQVRVYPVGREREPAVRAPVVLIGVDA
jgi:hypothetical protein